MTPVETALFVLAGAVVSTVVTAWVTLRWGSVVHRWADRHGYRIVTLDSRSVLRGPFTGNVNQYQLVYRVTVEDHTGHRKSGWILCGGDSGLGPLLSDRVDEVWDE